MKLAYAEEIRRLDRIAIEDYRIPGLILMENAGAGTVKAMEEHFGELDGRTVAVVVGPGNNGGDGLVIARHLLQRGGLPLVFLLVKPEKFKGDAAVNLEIVCNLEIPLFIVDDREKIKSLINCLPDCDLIVDAIFGTGLTRKPAGHFFTAIETINSACCPVVSVDHSFRTQQRHRPVSRHRCPGRTDHNLRLGQARPFFRAWSRTHRRPCHHRHRPAGKGPGRCQPANRTSGG